MAEDGGGISFATLTCPGIVKVVADEPQPIADRHPNNIKIRGRRFIWEIISYTSWFLEY